MKRFLLNVSTEWCGEENTYAAYAKSEDELYELLDELAYENFLEFGGLENILKELFPDVEPEDYTDEMYEEAAKIGGEYYYGNIEEWDETRSEEEWNEYELVRGDDEEEEEEEDEDEDDLDEEEYVEVEEEDDEDDIDEEEYD